MEIVLRAIDRPAEIVAGAADGGMAVVVVVEEIVVGAGVAAEVDIRLSPRIARIFTD